MFLTDRVGSKTRVTNTNLHSLSTNRCLPLQSTNIIYSQSNLNIQFGILIKQIQFIILKNLAIFLVNNLIKLILLRRVKISWFQKKSVL